MSDEKYKIEKELSPKNSENQAKHDVNETDSDSKINKNYENDEEQK